LRNEYFRIVLYRLDDKLTKRVYRLMREDNLLCLRRRKFVVTTDSAHALPVYPNRARQMTQTGLDQLWVAVS
jgi:transposase InsO family protein